jgi:hypothetical protein
MREDWIADSTASAIAASCDGIGTPISIPLCNPTFRFSPAHWHTILNLSGRNTYSMTLLARDELVEIGHKKHGDEKHGDEEHSSDDFSIQAHRGNTGPFK